MQMATTTTYGVSPWLIGLIETMVAGTDYTLAQLSEKVISKKTFGLPLAYTQLFVNEIDPQVSCVHVGCVLSNRLPPGPCVCWASHCCSRSNAGYKV